MAWSDAARAAAIKARRMRVMFSATNPQGRRFKGLYVVRATDNYAAMDAIAKRIGKKYEGMTNRVFKFGKPKLVMSRRLAKVIAGAGPEES